MKKQNHEKVRQQVLPSQIMSKESFLRKSTELHHIMSSLNNTEKLNFQKFINLCTRNGKKNKARTLLLKIMCKFALAKGKNGINIFFEAIENAKPVVEVKKVRIAGTTQLVPSIIPQNRQRNLAIRWILEAALQRYKIKKNRSLEECIFAELVDVSQNKGNLRKKKDDLHKMAESNRGFAHYRWW